MWAYEMPHNQLIDKLAEACARSGTANSGLVIDVMAGSYAWDAGYFKGVVLSRLEGLAPPLRPGNLVRCVRDSWKYYRDSYEGPSNIEANVQLAVSRVWYKDGKWFLEFKEYGDHYCRFPAEDFELIEQPVPA